MLLRVHEKRLGWASNPLCNSSSASRCADTQCASWRLRYLSSLSSFEQLELQKSSHVFPLFSELSWRGARGAEVNVRGLKLGKTHGDSFVLPTSICWPTPPTKLHKSSWKQRHDELLNELRCSLDPPRSLASSKVAFQVHCDLDVSLGAIPQFDLKDLKAVQQ